MMQELRLELLQKGLFMDDVLSTALLALRVGQVPPPPTLRPVDVL